MAKRTGPKHYMTGPHGGLYYLSSAGTKVYVKQSDERYMPAAWRRDVPRPTAKKPRRRRAEDYPGQRKVRSEISSIKRRMAREGTLGPRHIGRWGWW